MNRGLFEPLVMFFGLTNSPATFQTMMNDIFRDLISEGTVCVYLNDILILTKTRAEHRRVTRLVLERLREHQLYLKQEKCKFECTWIEYLGLIISEGHVEMDPVKIAGVAEWPTPGTHKEVQSFLGFTNFYRRFIKNFAHLARPLFDLTKANADFSWGPSQQQAFEDLKRAITSAPILILAQDDQPYQIEADSSNYTTGAVLSQCMPDGSWHLVAFQSKSLSPVERNYEIHDKEMLAIIWALDEWRHFLEGARHPFEIWTDHKNLEYFMSAKKLNRRQARWSLVLSRFDFTLTHRPGQSMGKPDSLSRCADHGQGRDDNQGIMLLKPSLFVIRATEGVETDGPEKQLLEEVRHHNREGHMEEAVAKAWKELTKSRHKLVHSADWKQQDGILYYQDCIYVPRDPDLRWCIVELHHNTPLAGHPGRWKTWELVSRNYWWPQISRYVGDYCRACDLCLCTKAQRHAPTGELQPLPIPAKQWEDISMDFIVKLPESNSHNTILVVVNRLSKRAHFIPTHTTVMALGTARLFLSQVWRYHGLLRRTVSDRGTQFVAEFTRELWRLLSIDGAHSTAYHPQTDGQMEQVNQELEQFLRLFVNERQNNWHDLLPLAEFAYNNCVHASTQFTPFYLDTGRHPRMGFEPQPTLQIVLVNEFAAHMKNTLKEARAALHKAREDMIRYYNTHRTPTPVYQVRDVVYVSAEDFRTTQPSQKLSHQYLGPWPITEKVSTHAYRIKLPACYSKVHPVFGIIKLLPAPQDKIEGHIRCHLPPPDLIDGVEEYEVKRVLDSDLLL
ncbi:hypothetical protein AX17_004426 [Amanita inopinata Kibby_2008]|nr:hypothetical protein AX17_004426 [Amanita inopinata Kibby_2008]